MYSSPLRVMPLSFSLPKLTSCSLSFFQADSCSRHLTPPVTASYPTETFHVQQNPPPGSDAVEGRVRRTRLLGTIDPNEYTCEQKHVSLA